MSFLFFVKKEEAPVEEIKLKPTVTVNRVKTDTISLMTEKKWSPSAYENTYEPARLADLEEFCRKVRQSGAGDDQPVNLYVGRAVTTVDQYALEKAQILESAA